MLVFRVLEPRGPDRVLWQSMFELLPADYRLVHFSPGYALTQSLDDNDKALCAFVMDDMSGNYAMWPFVLRDTRGRRSIESCYGYGGPIANTLGVEGCKLVVDLDRHMRGWRADHRVICERVVLQPQLADKQRVMAPWVKVQTKEVVVVSTTSLDAASDLMRDTRRHAIAKARKARLSTVRSTSNGATLARFAELYRATMMRNEAEGRWMHEYPFFERIMRELRGHAVIISTVMSREKLDKAVSAAMVLICGSNAHYQYAGNSLEAAGASDLLIADAISLAYECGCKWLDLGGGVTAAPDDSVMFYKSSFSPARRPVFVGTRVFDQRAFDEAAALSPKMDFFPPWRA